MIYLNVLIVLNACYNAHNKNIFVESKTISGFYALANQAVASYEWLTSNSFTVNKNEILYVIHHKKSYPLTQIPLNLIM